MRRRTAITGLATSLLGLSGCLGETATQTETPTTGSSATPTTTSTESSGLVITKTHTYSHAVRLNNLGASPIGQIPSIDSLSDREQAVVQAALDDTYTTDSVPNWLAKFLAETTYIRAGTDYHQLDSTFPTTTITATEKDRDAVSGEIATYETYETAVTHDGLARTGLLRSARQGGVELTYVWPSLQSLLESYEAVEFQGTVLSVSSTATDPSAPYTVTATSVSLSDLADGPVWRLSTASQSVQTFVREAAAESGLYAFDNPPEDALTHLREHRYVFVDGEFYTTYVEQAGTPPIAVQASPNPQTTDSQMGLQLTLQNSSSTAVQISSGAPTPFGVLRYHKQGDESRGGLLWSPAYEDSQYVQTEGRDVVSVNSIGLSSTIEANGSTGRSFTIDSRSISSGKYVIEGYVGYDIDEENGTVPYTVEFTVGGRG